MWKRGEISPLFHIILYIIFLTSEVKLHIHLLNVVVQFIVFLALSTLICQSTDISKCFSESLGIRDNESRLYFFTIWATLKGKNLLLWEQSFSFKSSPYFGRDSSYSFQEFPWCA